MNFTVYYIDDPTHPQTIQANVAHRAAWQFVQQHSRTDTSQVTVESHPSVPWRTPETTHYRACDLFDIPAPPDEPWPDLAIQRVGTGEPGYVVTGSIDSLRILATGLLRSLDEFPTRADPLRSNQCHGVPLVPGDGPSHAYYLSFQVDPDVEQVWARRHGTRGFLRKYGSCLFISLVAVLTCLGIWTAIQWIVHFARIAG